MLILPLSTPSSGGLPPGVTSPGDGALNYVTGALSASRPSINVAQTWNNAALEFDASDISITDTASAAGSRAMRVRLNGAEIFRLGKNGQIEALGVRATVGNVTAGNALVSAGSIFSGMSFDTSLQRDAAGVWSQRNGTAAQTYRLERTYTDPSSRGYTDFAQDAAGGLRINSVWTGGVAAPTNLLDVQGNGASRLRTDRDGITWLPVATADDSMTASGLMGEGSQYGMRFRSSGTWAGIHFLMGNSYAQLLLQAGSSPSFITSSAGGFGWASVANTVYGTVDTKVTRNAAGVVEINNGTAGQYRDLILRDLTAVGGTVTASTPVLDLAQTWNNAGVQFTGLRFSVTDTASDGNSMIMSLQTGGSNRFTFGKLGQFQFSGFAMSNNFDVALASTGLSQIGLILGSSSLISWTGGGTLSAADLFLRRGGANTLAQRNGLSPQAYELFNSYTDPSNYERGFIRWAANALEIGADAAGNGAQRAISFKLGSATPLALSPTSSTFTGDLVLANGFQFRFSAGTNIWCASAGNLILWDSAQTSFGRLQFGGVSSSYPALKRSGATLQSRLADDSGFADFAMRDLYLGPAAVSGTITPTHTMTIYANGVAYKVPCVAA
jgi:hypothetical protein